MRSIDDHSVVADRLEAATIVIIADAVDVVVVVRRHCTWTAHEQWPIGAHRLRHHLLLLLVLWAGRTEQDNGGRLACVVVIITGHCVDTD